MVYLAMPPAMLPFMLKAWHNGQLTVSFLPSIPRNHSIPGDKFTHMLSISVKSVKIFFLEKKLPVAVLCSQLAY